MKKETNKAIRPLSNQNEKRMNDLIDNLLDEIVEQTRKMAVEANVQPAVFMLNLNE